MIDGAQGYRTDIDYIHNYYRELNPLRLRLALLNAGLRPPPIATACELGFGQGVSLAIHAAAAPVRWHGTDINPGHADFARSLATASGAEIGIFSDSFVDFANRDLPAFDYIGLHGVWSWISDENRAVIVDFIRRRLKPGGVIYAGYNTLPGYAAFVPLRHMLVEHANRAGSEARPIADRIDGALAFMERLLATEPSLVRDNPKLLERFATVKGEDRHYLAHEYFNRDWQPMHFADMARWLAPADMSYACAIDYSDHLDVMGLSAAQRRLMDEIGDAGLRETVKDLIANQQFRRDCWVRGAQPLSAEARAEALRHERVVAVARPLELPFKMKAALALSQAGPGEAVCSAMLERLADGKVWSLGRIEQALLPKGFSVDRIAGAVVLAAGSGLIEAAQDDDAIAHARPGTDRLNAHLIAAAHTSDKVQALASPVTGGGVSVDRLEQLFLAAILRGQTRPEDWAGYAAEVLAADATRVDLAAAVRSFATDRLPVLRALQVV